jgi:tetratricopeptide (TPR) repeat protein
MRHALAIAVLLAVSGTTAAYGATPPAYAGADQPAVHKHLDELFDALAKAGSEEEAKPIEDQILTAFLESGSASIDLLMTRGASALQDGDIKTAKELFQSVTDIAPDFAEGWHQRARMEAVSGHDQAAMVNLQRTITLNPRQFEAYAELGDMLQDYGDKAGALAMYRKALALDPSYDDVARRVRELTRAVEGERI